MGVVERLLAGVVASVAYVGMGTVLPAQDVDMSISVLPAILEPGKPALITFSYEMDPGFAEKRLVYVVEVRSADTDAVLRTVTYDNSGNGYTAGSGSMNFAQVMPLDTSAVYFTTYASPWSINRWVVDQFRSYPTNGTWTYLWAGGGYGVTQDVIYRGSVIAPKPATNTTYCSGIAFEVGVVAHLNYNQFYNHQTIGGMTVSQMNSFRRVWYGTLSDDPDPHLKLAALAIPKFGIGREITNFEEVQEGDFVQLWRHSGSGHNPIFVSWIRNASGQITGMNYWGSQGSTNGIGFNSELFGTSGSRMDPARTYFGRIARPRDQGDIEFALVTMSTVDSPTMIGVPPEPMLNGWAVY